MIEEELINKIWKANSNKIRLLLTKNTIQKEEYLSDLIRYGIKQGFQKGKLEQKKEELKFLKERCIYCMIADERIKQLQKEISVPEKQVQIGEEKQDENS